MGNEQGKPFSHITKRRLEKSREIPDSKSTEETKGKSGENEKEDEIKNEDEKEEKPEGDSDDMDEGSKEINQEKCKRKCSEDKEEPHQDETSGGGGETDEDKGAGGVTPQVLETQLVQPVPRSEEEFVGLNVGGVVYTTSRSTLVRYPDSLLGVIFTALVPTPKDDQGNYMIDADGQMFRHILNYLRRGALTLPKGFEEHRLLHEEAAFFQLPDLKMLIAQHSLNSSQIVPRDTLPQTQIKVEPAEETSKYVIEIYVSEEDNTPQSWRIYGSLGLLSRIPTLTDYLHHYRKGSQCLEFTTQHPMFPTNTFKRFPKTTLFYHIFDIGFKLHTSDSLEIIDEDNARIPWLRYLFTSTKL